MIPDACIFPAVRITRSPTASFSFESACMIASLSTPTPGLPVRTIMSTPISAAFLALSTVAWRPVVRFQTDSSSLFLIVAGSRFIATILPVRRFTSRIVSSGDTCGNPWITG